MALSANVFLQSLSFILPFSNWVPSSLDSLPKTTFWLPSWPLWASNLQMASLASEDFYAKPSTISDLIWNSSKRNKPSPAERRNNSSLNSRIKRHCVR